MEKYISKEMLKEIKTKTFDEMLDNPRMWAKLLLGVADEMDRRKVGKDKILPAVENAFSALPFEFN